MRFLMYSLLLCTLCALPALAQARIWSGAAFLDIPSLEGNMCALTFDDGPSPHTDTLLAALAEENVKATFFVLGHNVNIYPDNVRHMVAAGHEVGSHSYSHPNMRQLSQAKQAQELVNSLISLHMVGVQPRWFRPPFGNYTVPLQNFSALLGMSTALWSHDSQDWKRAEPPYDALLSITGRPSPAGQWHGVFLFHERARTTRDIHTIINAMRNGGCQQFVTLSEYTSHLPAQTTTADPKQLQAAGQILQNTLASASVKYPEDASALQQTLVANLNSVLHPELPLYAEQSVPQVTVPNSAIAHAAAAKAATQNAHSLPAAEAPALPAAPAQQSLTPPDSVASHAPAKGAAELTLVSEKTMLAKPEAAPQKAEEALPSHLQQQLDAFLQLIKQYWRIISHSEAAANTTGQP
ncbi:MAG: polysaccharide deacetylase family protein [Desulfovibrionaceae bacterium]|nr:polysaccharide deacetylase family protein [Desulfovibrionaceae bacterium]